MKYNVKGFYVYMGLDKNNKIVYIGTTIQIPKDRFRWHKYHGKDLNFIIIQSCDNKDEMLDLEYKLIQEYKPKLNVIQHRKQNFNVKLTIDELESRKGSKEWCQRCLKRRVKANTKYCYYCTKRKNS